MTMETMQRTSYIRHQYSEQRVSSMSMSRNATRNQILPPPKQVEPDPKKVKKKNECLTVKGHSQTTYTSFYPINVLENLPTSSFITYFVNDP